MKKNMDGRGWKWKKNGKNNIKLKKTEVSPEKK